MTATPDDDDRRPPDDVFRALVDGAADGLFVIDPDTGRIVDANRTVCEWLGYSRAEVRELTILDCQTTFSEPSEWRTFVDGVREDGEARIENEIETRGGETIPVEGTITVVSADDGEYVVASPRRLPTDDG